VVFARESVDDCENMCMISSRICVSGGVIDDSRGSLYTLVRLSCMFWFTVADMVSVI
jgi:hypothetical protein